jgi:hypothetical protein
MQRLTRNLSRFLALPRPERRIFLTAMALHPLFWLGLHVFGYASFRARLDRMPPLFRAQEEVKLDALFALGRLVNLASRHTPMPATCLSRSLVLCWLLRRRGIPCELRIGVQLVRGKLDAHAWVEHEGIPINDTQDVAQRYAAFGGPLTTGSFTAQ